MNPTSQFSWWPKVKDLLIPVPRTDLLMLNEPTAADELMDDISATNLAELHAISYKIKEIGNTFGWPLFLRTDLLSGKHDWKRTCFVASADDVDVNLGQLIEAQCLLLDFNFEEDTRIHGFVVREMLDLAPAFTAFRGMPVGAERRYFVRDGELECHHPYWIEAAIEQGSRDLPVDWRVSLADLNYEEDEEKELLRFYSEQAGKALGDGFWSVDFARAGDGTWYLLDIAVGENSWHPEHGMPWLNGHEMTDAESDYLMA